MILIISILFMMPLCAMEEESLGQDQILKRLHDLQAQDSVLIELKEKISNEQLQQEKLNNIYKIIRHLPSKFQKLKEFDFSKFGVNATDCGETILHAALYLGCHQVARLLIAAGAGVNEPTFDEMNTPLMYSVRGAQ